VKKQFVSLFFLFLLIAPAVVTYTWIQHRKRVIKKEVKWKMIAGIDKNELVILKFSHSEIKKLNWKHSKEFEFNHQMYDIVSKSSTKDSITYWCWWDIEETKLNQQLQQLLVTSFHTDFPIKNKQNLVVEFYKSFFFQQPILWQPDRLCTFLKRQFFYINLYNSEKSQIEDPPPVGI
jgi:hypothetical protein